MHIYILLEQELEIRYCTKWNILFSAIFLFLQDNLMILGELTLNKVSKSFQSQPEPYKYI